MLGCYEAKVEETERPPGVEPRTPATELQQPDNQQPSQSCASGTEMPLVAHLAVTQYVPSELC